jgi:hypothetical protein
MEGALSTPDTGAATTGPTSFSDASLTWTEDSSASTPDPASTATDSASADATVPPVDASTPDGHPPTAGAPPPERWETILENARVKAREEAIAPLAWAKDVPQAEFQQIQTLARNLYGGGDPVAGLQTLIAEMRKDPAIESQIRSFAARTLAQRSTPPVANQEPSLVPVQLEDGRVVRMPEDPQAWLAWHQQKWMQGVEQKLQPLQQTHETLQAERAAIAQQQEITNYTTREISGAAKWKGMDNPDFRAKVAQALERVPVASDDPRDVSLAFREAYMAVRDADDVTLTQRAQSTLLDSLKTKAAASTSVNPGSAAASTPRRVDRFDQLPPEAWK